MQGFISDRSSPHSHWPCLRHGCKMVIFFVSLCSVFITQWAETGETHFVQTRLQGLALVLIPLEDLHLKMMADGLFLMAFLTTILCFGISPTFKLFKGKCPHRCIHQNMNILRAIHVVLMCILTLVAFPWTMLPGPHFTPSNFDHYFILFGTWLFNILRVTQLNEELLEDRELERQATNLDFTSLADATCSNQRDEARIREAIAGFESEVEIAILILMKAGAYDDSQLVFAEDFVIFCLLSWDEGGIGQKY